MTAMPPKPAWKTYTMVTLAMLPTLAVWFFWLGLFMPKFRYWWHRGTGGSEVEHMSAPLWFMGLWSSYAFVLAPVILICGIVILVILECTMKKWWPRWRLRVLTGLAILFNTIIMVTICFNMVLSLMLVQVSQKGVKSVEKILNKNN